MLKEKASLIPNGLDEKVFTPKYLPGEFFPLDDPRNTYWKGGAAGYHLCRSVSRYGRLQNGR